MEKVDVGDILLFISTILSIVVSIYCVKKAGNLNRSKFGWALFGFCVPIVALIVIQFMKPHQSAEILNISENQPV
jgi:hypothetical protein